MQLNLKNLELKNIMNNIFVSIIIPTRNRPFFVLKAVESILSQSYKYIEIIVSDNSTDLKTETILSNYQESKIRYIRQSGLLEMYENWNAALDKATGEFVVLLSDDDYLEPTFVEDMIEALKKTDKEEDVAIIYSSCNIVDVDGNIVGATRVQSGVEKSNQSIINYLNGRYANYPCCIMYRREDILNIGGFRYDRYGLPADVAAWILIATKREYVLSIDKQLSNYRLHGGNATLGNNKNSIINGLNNLRLDIQAYMLTSGFSSLDINKAFNRFNAIVLLSLASLGSKSNSHPILYFFSCVKILSINISISRHPLIFFKALFASSFPTTYSRSKKMLSIVKNKARAINF